MSTTMPQRGGTERAILVDETNGIALDLPATFILPLEVEAEAEERAPVASGGWRITSRALSFGVTSMRADLARILREMRQRGSPLIGWGLGRPSARGGVHTAFLDPCTPGGSSPGGATNVARFVGESVVLSSRRYRAAAWTSPDLAADVPFDDGTLASAPLASLPYVPRVPTSSLALTYAAPGNAILGTSGYDGPLWACEAMPNESGFTADAEAVLVLPLPAPAARIRVSALSVEDGPNVTITLLAFDRAGALVGEVGGDAATAGAEASADILLSPGAWYLCVIVDGPTSSRPRVWLDEAYARQMPGGITDRASAYAEAVLPAGATTVVGALTVTMDAVEYDLQTLTVNPVELRNIMFSESGKDADSLLLSPLYEAFP